MKKVFYFAGSMMAGTLIACSGGNQKKAAEGQAAEQAGNESSGGCGWVYHHFRREDF